MKVNLKYCVLACCFAVYTFPIELPTPDMNAEESQITLNNFITENSIESIKKYVKTSNRTSEAITTSNKECKVSDFSKKQLALIYKGYHDTIAAKPSLHTIQKGLKYLTTISSKPNFEQLGMYIAACVIEWESVTSSRKHKIQYNKTQSRNPKERIPFNLSEINLDKYSDTRKAFEQYVFGNSDTDAEKGAKLFDFTQKCISDSDFPYAIWKEDKLPGTLTLRLDNTNQVYGFLARTGTGVIGTDNESVLFPKDKNYSPKRGYELSKSKEWSYEGVKEVLTDWTKFKAFCTENKIMAATIGFAIFSTVLFVLNRIYTHNTILLPVLTPQPMTSNNITIINKT